MDAVEAYETVLQRLTVPSFTDPAGRWYPWALKVR